MSSSPCCYPRAETHTSGLPLCGRRFWPLACGRPGAASTLVGLLKRGQFCRVICRAPRVLCEIHDASPFGDVWDPLDNASASKGSQPGYDLAKSAGSRR